MDSNNSNHIEKIRQFYTDTHGQESRWEDNSYLYSWRNPVGLYMRWRIQHSIIKMLNKNSIILSDKKILDIGCGYGEWLHFFSVIRGDSQNLVGIDITEERIKRARMINPGINFICSDATYLPFADQSFDIVMQFDCFEHFVDEEALNKASSEVIRILKRNGMLIWFDLLPFCNKLNPMNRGYTLKEVIALFNRFELIDYETIFKRFDLGSRVISTAYNLPGKKLEFTLIYLIERLPFEKCNNLLALLGKND